MNRITTGLVLVGMGFVVVACGGAPDPEPTPEPAPSAVSEPTITPKATGCKTNASCGTGYVCIGGQCAAHTNPGPGGCTSCQ